MSLDRHVVFFVRPNQTHFLFALCFLFVCLLLVCFFNFSNFSTFLGAGGGGIVNRARAFEDLRKLYGVGSILDPDDPQCCADEKATITYLAEVMKAMPRTQGEEGKERRRKSPEERREAIDPRKASSFLFDVFYF